MSHSDPEHQAFRSMCRIVTAAVILLLAFPEGVAHAQENRILLFGGPSFSNVHGVDTGEFGDMWETRSSIAVGVGVTVPVADRLSVQPELGLSFRGASHPQLFRVDREAGRERPVVFPQELVELTYLELPVVARAEILASPEKGLYGLVGPRVALLVDCDFSFGAREKRNCDDTQLLESASEWDVGFVTGLGAWLRVGSGKQRFGMEARYSRGLKEVDRSLENEALTLLLTWSTPF